ncbi:MAG TPA: HEAT repeat domain-containing protein [Thermogutta sp.]|nr:HEAT repeat domain-containing protein [Thermogutta sp.]
MTRILAAIFCLITIIAGRLCVAEDVSTLTDSAKLVAILESKESSDFEKAVACKRLAVFGTAEAVPVLAKMLLDEKFSHYARYALEPIPAAVVDDALREALSRAEGGVRLGILNSIGVRRDTKAVVAIAPLLNHDEPAVVDAAASALGRIANVEAADILKKSLQSEKATTRRAVGDALLICAEIVKKEGNTELAIDIFDAVRKADVPKPVRLAAMRGAVMARGDNGVTLLKELLETDDSGVFDLALRVAREMKSAAATEELVKHLGVVSEDRQAKIVEALADAGVQEALPAIRKAVAEASGAMKLAAIRSLAKCGDKSDVALLLEVAKSSDEVVAEQAKAALVSLQGPGVGEALADSLAKEDSKGKLVLLEVVGQRRTLAASPVVRQLAASADPSIRLAAIRTLGNLGQDEDVAMLVERLITSPSADDVAAVKDALQAASQRVRDRDAIAKMLIQHMDKAPGNTRRDLLEVLGSLGGPTALAAVAGAAQSQDSSLQDAATAILGNWLSPDVAPVLWDLIQKNAAPQYRIRLIRGYIRVARQFSVPDAERLAMCRNALQVSDRPDERRLVMDVLRRNPSAEGLALAVAEIDRPGMRAAACETIVTIAEKLQKNVPGLREALSQVVQKATDPAIKARAQAILERLP